MTPEELDLVPTQDLIDALKRRFETIVFAGLEVRSSEVARHLSSYHGDRWHAAGLTAALTALILDDVDRAVEEAADNDTEDEA